MDPSTTVPAATARPWVVGIGASAGGLDALKLLVPILPVAGVCHVVVQHLAPGQPSKLAEILMPYSPMPVRALEGSCPAEPDCILVAPPGHHVEFDGQRLNLIAPPAGQHPVPSIDRFFASLARQLGPGATGIVLSGTGSDGALGLAAIRSAGGDVFFQSRASARYAAMPEAARAAVGPQAEHALAELAVELSDSLWRRRRRAPEAAAHSDLDLDLDQDPGSHGDSPALPERDARSASLWLDAPMLEALATRLMTLLTRKGPQEALRVWVADCAGGETAYTLAMLCATLIESEGRRRPLQVFATGTDAQALALARAARYPRASTLALPAELRHRWVKGEGEWVQIERHLRERVACLRTDPGQGLGLTRLDLVCARGHTGLSSPADRHLLHQQAHFGLRPGGLLWLDEGEAPRLSRSGFEREDPAQPIWTRSAHTTIADLPAPLPQHPALPDLAEPTLAERAFLRMAGGHLPACVLLDGNLQVLHLHGDLSRFLALQPGTQTRHDLLHLADAAVRPMLEALCALPPAPGVRRGVDLTLPRRPGTARHWHVERLDGRDRDGRALMLLTFLSCARRVRRTDAENALLGPLGEQLQATRAELQRLGDETQAAQEALQASNEELETANEELLATNEELTLVNAELRDQWDRFQRLSQELQSIGDSVPNPMLVLDGSGRLTRCNEAARRALQVRPEQVGLPPGPLLEAAGLGEAALHLRAALPVEAAFTRPLAPAPDGRTWLLQISPHRVGAQNIGSIVTLLDNTALARSERHSRNIEQRLIAMMSHGGALVAVRDPAGRYLYANAPYGRFFGVEVDRLCGHTAFQCLPPATARQLRAGDAAALAAAGTVETEESFELADGARSWWVNRFVMYADDGGVDAVCEQAVDVTRWRAADTELRIAARIFDCSAEGILITDPQLRIVRVNEAFERSTGYQAAEVIGQRPSLLSSGRHDAAFYAQMWAAIQRQGRWQGEIWNQRKDGSHYAELLSICALRDDDGAISHYVGVFVDLSPLIESRNHAEHLATHDSLTGLPNRALLSDRLSHAVEAAARSGQELALCFIDLDHFKTINDSLGHDAGDELLRTAARRIAEQVRHADTVARLGGDEFVLLLENTDRTECLHTVNRLMRALAQPLTLSGTELNTAASIGVAFYPHDGCDGATLMQHADAAMYRAKHAGRGRCEFYASEVGEGVRTRLRVESGLRSALKHGELQLHYQPQVDICRHRVVGVEALLRWPAADGGWIAPSLFLPIAEESALIDQIGEWVIAQACEQLARWRRAGLVDLCISVNMSAHELGQPHFAERIQAHLVSHGLPGDALLLEITESALLQQGPAHLPMLQRLAALGIRLSLDDFGTGYSSLSHLRQLPLHELKIDRSFVAGMLDRRDDREIVAAIAGLAGALGLQVVAEGVETDAQQRHLQQLGRHVLMQGWRYTRALPAEDCERWIRDWTAGVPA